MIILGFLQIIYRFAKSAHGRGRAAGCWMQVARCSGSSQENARAADNGLQGRPNAREGRNPPGRWVSCQSTQGTVPCVPFEIMNARTGIRHFVKMIASSWSLIQYNCTLYNGFPFRPFKQQQNDCSFRGAIYRIKITASRIQDPLSVTGRYILLCHTDPLQHIFFRPVRQFDSIGIQCSHFF